MYRPLFLVAFAVFSTIFFSVLSVKVDHSTHFWVPCTFLKRHVSRAGKRRQIKASTTVAPATNVEVHHVSLSYGVGICICDEERGDRKQSDTRRLCIYC